MAAMDLDLAIDAYLKTSTPLKTLKEGASPELLSFIRAEEAFQQELYQEALAKYMELRIKRRTFFCYRASAFLYQALNNPERALEYAAKALAEYPNDPHSLRLIEKLKEKPPSFEEKLFDIKSGKTAKQKKSEALLSFLRTEERLTPHLRLKKRSILINPGPGSLGEFQKAEAIDTLICLNEASLPHLIALILELKECTLYLPEHLAEMVRSLPCKLHPLPKTEKSYTLPLDEGLLFTYFPVGKQQGVRLDTEYGAFSFLPRGEAEETVIHAVEGSTILFADFSLAQGEKLFKAAPAPLMLLPVSKESPLQLFKKLKNELLQAGTLLPAAEGLLIAVDNLAIYCKETKELVPPEQMHAVWQMTTKGELLFTSKLALL